MSYVTTTIYFSDKDLAMKIGQDTRMKWVKEDDAEFKMKSYADNEDCSHTS